MKLLQYLTVKTMRTGGRKQMNDPKEAIKFFRVQLNRCKINLKGAQDRHDDRAVDNIKHKMEIYEFTIKELSSK